jgi:hypothetical protein
MTARRPPSVRRHVILGAVLLVAVTVGCRRRAATVDDCRAILDKIIDLELTESGYRDPVLRERWQRDLDRRFGRDLDRCKGLAVRRSLGRCISDARTPEEIVHRCFD